MILLNFSTTIKNKLHEDRVNLHESQVYFSTARNSCIFKNNSPRALFGQNIRTLQWNPALPTPIYNGQFHLSRQKAHIFLQVTRGACNHNLHVVITHASHVCGQHSFRLPLRMNGMHKTQFDHTCFDLLPCVI